MNLKALIVVPFVLLTGCSDVLCPLLGEFGGRFVGDAEGDVNIDVVAGEDEEMAEASIRLSAPPLDVFGTAVIDCDMGMFSARLETTDNPDFGEFSGLLGEDLGEGEWSFASGESGTWDISKLLD
ncbi:MAG: hypothetical protein AAF721_26450 [Myxococcota bacterium]